MTNTSIGNVSINHWASWNWSVEDHDNGKIRSGQNYYSISTFENDEQRTKIEQNQSENAETRERNRKKVNTAVIRNDQIQMHLKMLCSLQKKKSHHFEMWFYTWRRHISIKLVTLFFRFCCCVHMVLCFCYYCRPSYALRVRPHRFAIACNHAIQARTHNTIRRHYQMTATDAPIMLRKEFSHSIYTTRQNRV